MYGECCPDECSMFGGVKVKSTNIYQFYISSFKEISGKINHINIRNVTFQALPSWPQGKGGAELCCLQEIRRPLKCGQEGNDRYDGLRNSINWEGSLLNFLFTVYNFHLSRRDYQPDGHRLAEVHGHGPADQHHLVEPAPDRARHVLSLGHPGRLVIGR